MDDATTTDDYASHYSGPSFWKKLKKHASTAGREVVEKALVLFYVGTDPATPKWAKGVIAGALGYFILPVDAIPDFLPGMGYSDDLAAIAVALVSIAGSITREHRQKAKDKLAQWFD